MAAKKQLFIISVFAIIFLHMVIFEQGMGGDGWGYYATLESICQDGDLDLENNIHGVYNGFSKCQKTGKWIVQYPLGTAIMDIPFYLIMDYLRQLIPVSAPVGEITKTANAKNADKILLFRILGVITAHNFYTVMGLLALYFTLINNNFSSKVSGLIVFLAYFASPLHFYGQSGMSHANSFFTISVILFLYSRFVISNNKRLLFLLGIFCGLAASIRFTNFLILPLLSLFIFLFMKDRSLKKFFCCNTLIFCGFISVFWLVPLFWWFHSGQLKPAYSGKFFFNQIPLINILFSLKRGFMIFHPLFSLVFLGIPAYLYLPALKNTHSKPVALFACACAFTLSAVYGYYGEWWGSGSYSQRYLTDFVSLFAFCLAPVYLFEGKMSLIIKLFTLSALIYSYFLFIVSVSKVLDLPSGDVWPLYIYDHLYFFKNSVTVSEIITGIKENVYGVKCLSHLFR